MDADRFGPSVPGSLVPYLWPSAGLGGSDRATAALNATPGSPKNVSLELESGALASIHGDGGILSLAEPRC